MSRSTTRKIDGTRRRCVECGHPRVEHRGPRGCTVPNCRCDEYSPPPSLQKELEGDAD